MILCAVIVTTAIKIYFKKVLKFEATLDEIYTFNGIFCTITLIYILLFISHQYLYKINTEKLLQEQLIKQNIEDDFKQFKRGINPNLLFESFEALIILVKENKDKADDFIDHLATIYRYILSAKERQLVSFSEELEVLFEFEKLFNYLPYRTISIQNGMEKEFLTVPGSLLFIVEKIVRSTIVSSEVQLHIHLKEQDTGYSIEYISNDRITNKFHRNHLSEIERVFGIYSTQKISIEETESYRKILIPKLQSQS